MEKHQKIIQTLSDAQVLDFIELLGESLLQGDSLNSVSFLGAETLIQDEQNSEQLRAVLSIIATLSDPLGEYLRQQLIDNETYLKEERNIGDFRSIAAVELLPPLTALLIFLKGKVSLNIVDGKVNFSMNIAWSFSFNNNNSLGNTDRLDSNEFQTLKNLIKVGKIEETMQQVFDSYPHNHPMCLELVILSAELETFKKKNRLGLLSNEEINVFRSQITYRILSVLDAYT